MSWNLTLWSHQLLQYYVQVRYDLCSIFGCQRVLIDFQWSDEIIQNGYWDIKRENCSMERVTSPQLQVVITPRHQKAIGLNFLWTNSQVYDKDPFCCIACGTEFQVKLTHNNESNISLMYCDCCFILSVPNCFDKNKHVDSCIVLKHVQNGFSDNAVKLWLVSD